MAVKVKGLNALTQKLKIAINIRDDALLREVGQKAVDLIVGFTRSGKSIDGPTPKELKELSPKYIEQRRRTKKETDPEFFKPAKSNLTFTGQLLRSIGFTINKIRASVFIGPSGTRSDGLTNKKVAGYVAKGGRPFIGMHDKGLAQIRNIVRRNLRRKLRSR